MIAIDWGTTSLRAYRLSASGRVLEARTAAQGILSVAPGGFPAALAAQARDWIGAGESPLLMCGMVGSRQGWAEVPYVQCPAGLAEVARRIFSLDEVTRIVPGLSCVDPSGVPDVMRGEETQILGVLDMLPAQALVCLPGTHSKWASVREGRIVAFRSHFTGEAFAVLREHSLLGRMMEPGPLDDRAFGDGIDRSGDEGGLLHHLFGVRSRGLFGELSPVAAHSYLSGLLIGHELRAERAGAGKAYFLGARELVARYTLGCRLLGLESEALDPDAAARGLYLLSRA